MRRLLPILLLCFLHAAFGAEAENHWAYQPMAKAKVPTGDTGPTVHPVDHFIERRLADAKLEPAPTASPRVRYRRLHVNLLGLPPKPEKVDRFLAAFAAPATVDSARPADAETVWQQTIDELLASPHYGERQARLWLDVARYADSNGSDENKAMANAWRYRDWVIEAFNRDLPYDDFIRQQLAGDLLDHPEPTGTGFLVIGPKILAEQDKEKMIADIVDEQIDTTGRAFLAATLGCARCHDHKTDPVSHKDYYALAGMFHSTKTMTDLDKTVSRWTEHDISSDADRDARKHLEETRDAIQAELKDTRSVASQNLRDQIVEHADIYYASATGKLRQNNAQKNAQTNAKHVPTLIKPVLERWKQHAKELAKHSPAELVAARELPEIEIVAGKFGGAFHGRPEHQFDVPHRAELEPEELTLQAWVRLHQFPDGPDKRRWIVNKNDDEWTRGHYALLISGESAHAYMAPEGGQGKQLSIGGDGDDSRGAKLKLNTWHHLALRHDATHISLYLDGKRVAHEAARARQKSDGHLRIGGRADSYSEFEIGDIDEVRLYRRALSSNEIKKCAVGKPTDKGLVQAWNFDPETPEEQAALDHTERHELARELFRLPKNAKAHWSKTDRDAVTELEQRHKAASGAVPVPVEVMSVTEAKPVKIKLHDRGDHLKPIGEPIARAVPTQLGPAFPAIAEGVSGRRELAEWITDPEHPLTARVMVNRIWQQHFGHGLVRTPDNFGPSGEAPSHPQLLDWLARDFIRSGWSLKHLHKRIASSAAFQRSADHPASLECDPDNRLLARVPRQRLEVEMIRDSILAVSGRLDPARSGSLLRSKNYDYAREKEEVFDSTRRAIYLPVIRDRLYNVFDLFDLPEPSTSSSHRDSTVLPHQALFFLNSPLVGESATAFAERLDEKKTDAEKVDQAHRLAFARSATPAEQALAATFLKHGSWPDYCQALFASNEFLFVD